MFCVECGKEGDVVGPLCRECYAKKHITVSLPDHVDLILCAHCSSMHREGRWEDVESVKQAAETAVEDALAVPKGVSVRDVRVRTEEKDERNLKAQATVLLESQGVEAERELATIVRLKRGSCTECSKRMGSYYEAVLQVRGHGRALADSDVAEVGGFVSERLDSMRRDSRSVFLTKVERVRGGLDFYISTAHAARALARELQERRCAEYKESSSIWGKRGGEELHRMTFLVRLPGFGPGDVIEADDRDYYVRAMAKGVVRGIDLASGEVRDIKFKDAAECAVVARGASVRRAVVISEGEAELQLLDSATLKQVDVRKPPGFSRKHDQVRLVKTKRGFFVLSDSW